MIYSLRVWVNRAWVFIGSWELAPLGHKLAWPQHPQEGFTFGGGGGGACISDSIPQLSLFLC